MTDAFKPSYIESRQPVKEKILSEGTRQKAKQTLSLLLPTPFLNTAITYSLSLSLSLKLKKEERKE